MNEGTGGDFGKSSIASAFNGIWIALVDGDTFVQLTIADGSRGPEQRSNVAFFT